MTSLLDQDITSAGYFMRRLEAARYAQQLPASAQFDLARSPMSDDDLEDAVDAFRDAPRERGGWGMSPLLQDLLSKEPHTVAVSDLSSLQRNLVSQGFAPDDSPITGVWDPSWYASFRRMDQSALEMQRSGHHPLATPVRAGMNLITNTIPSRVFQGLVGTAKGLVTQAPETAERVGLAGGAAGGALIGAALGSVLPGPGTLLGAGAGAVVGGAIGFFSDLVDADGGEGDQSGWEQLRDALSPYEEYLGDQSGGQGAKAFFEDLGWVLAASSLVSGAGLAARGVAGGIGAASAIAEGGGTTSPVPSSAKPVIQAEAGVFTRVAGFAARKARVPETIVERGIDFIRLHGLVAQAGRPIFQTVNGGYTGLSAASLGARVAAGLGSGETETTIERAIRTAPELPAYVDYAGLIVNPTQFFPIKARQLASGAKALLGDTSMLPFASVVAKEKGVGIRQGVDMAREMMGADEAAQALTNTRLRLEYGLHRRALDRVAEFPNLTGAEPHAVGIYNRARFALIDELKSPVREISEGVALPKTRVLDTKSGRPLRVFHGTQSSFDELSDAATDVGGQYGPGHYFTEDAQGASEYALGAGSTEYLADNIVAPNAEEAETIARGLADQQGLRFGSVEETDPGVWTGLLVGPDAAPNVRTAFIDVTNPLAIDGVISEAAVGRVKKALATVAPDVKLELTGGVSGQEVWDKVSGALGVSERLGADKSRVTGVLREAGFDGITHLEGRTKGDALQRVWVAFDAAQVHPAYQGGAVPRGVVGKPLSEELIGYSLAEPAAFEGWLTETTMERLPDFLKAETLARNLTADIRTGRVSLDPSQIHGMVVGDASAAFDRLKQGSQVEQMLAHAAQLETTAAKGTEPVLAAKLKAEAVGLRIEAEKLRKVIPNVPGEPRTVANMTIVPERLDSQTTNTFKALAARYDDMQSRVLAATKAEKEDLAAAIKAGDPNAVGQMAGVVERQNLDLFVEELVGKGLIPESMASTALKDRPGKQISDHLRKRAKHAAAEIQLEPEVMSRFEALGYKPVVTSGDVLYTADVDQVAKRMDLGDYTKRAAFFETLSVSPRWQSDESLGRLREAHEVAELEAVLARRKGGRPAPAITAQGIRRKLFRYMNDLNTDGSLRGPLVFPKSGKPRLYRVDPRDLSKEDIVAALDGVPGFFPDQAADIYAALRRGAAYGGEVSFLHPSDTLRTIGRALRINGLPGFSDAMRTFRVADPNKLAIGATVGGAVLGATTGDDPLEDAIKGAIGGAVVGLGARKLAKKTYGYLPDSLVKVNNALRYSLSFTFDAGRYSEQNMIAAMKYQLPGMLNPAKAIKRKTWATPYSAVPQTGEAAWKDAVRYWDEINGTGSLFRNIDDADRRGAAAGLLGFSPRNFEAAQALQLYQRGMPKKEIKKALAEISYYGLGRTAAEKSANFIFFPFSFSKKLITTLGDFMLQAPARGLLLHEGMRRYYESGTDEKFHELMEKHAPLLQQLSQVSALSYGMSPGRFFLKGLADHRSGIGTAAQALTSFFVPGGSATPLAQAAGGMGDLIKHAFVPVVITGESLDRAGGIDGLDDIVRQYVPMVREIDQYFVGDGSAFGDQVTAIKEGAPPFAQLSSFYDEQREAKSEYQPYADALGYASVDGFLQSEAGAMIAPMLQTKQEEIATKYPTGFKLAQEITNTGALDKRALLDLANKADRSPAEDAILEILESIQGLSDLNDVMQLDSSVLASIAAQDARARAARYASDRRFAELWDRFFAPQYGPIQRTVA